MADEYLFDIKSCVFPQQGYQLIDRTLKRMMFLQAMMMFPLHRRQIPCHVIAFSENMNPINSSF